MNTQELAEKIACKFNFHKSDKYNMLEREFDNKIEVIGYMDDPNFDTSLIGRYIKPPKCWLTIGVVGKNEWVDKEWLLN